jgi:hypothetical protein
MKTEKWPPIDHGTQVLTTRPDLKRRSEWTKEGWKSRRWGVQGTIINHHDSHGLCYEVRHHNGTVGYYDPSEFQVI